MNASSNLDRNSKTKEAQLFIPTDSLSYYINAWTWAAAVRNIIELKSQEENLRKNATFAGNANAFSVCNKPFKPFGDPDGTSEVSWGFPATVPTKIKLISQDDYPASGSSSFLCLKL